MTTARDTRNLFMVGVTGGNIAILFPPRAPITPDQALNLAAYLVALADQTENHSVFAEILHEIENA